MTTTDSDSISAIVSKFNVKGSVTKVSVIPTGHINDTFKIVMRKPDGTDSACILQRINDSVFHNPDEVMDNIGAVTEWIRRKLKSEAGADPDRDVLRYEEVLSETVGSDPAGDNAVAGVYEKTPRRLLYHAPDGGFWRMCRFITGATCYDLIRSPEDFRQVGIAFGRFQRYLSDFPIETLHETIPDFHNTPKRLEALKLSADRDTADRKRNVPEELRTILDNQELAYSFYPRKETRDSQRTSHRMSPSGDSLPVRVTHNDAKLNNIMIDDKTGKAVCILDLDTVMPGFVMNDFGDAIRSGASTAKEDEPDLSKVSVDMQLYRVFAEGFLSGCGSVLTKEEIRLLPLGALVITYEQAVRFLSDYLDGDVYYKVDNPQTNLIRTRNQLKLFRDMKYHFEEMNQIIRDLL